MAGLFCDITPINQECQECEKRDDLEQCTGCVFAAAEKLSEELDVVDFMERLQPKRS